LWQSIRCSFSYSKEEEINITLQNGICDSCGNPSDVLFPIAILDELPTGGMGMVQRWYCIECKDELEQEAEENKDKDEDGEENEKEDKECPAYKLPKISWSISNWKLLW